MTQMYCENKGWAFKWTLEEDEILKENYSNKTIEEMLELLPNRNKQGIFSRASKLGVRRLYYNKKYFEVIDSHEKAYWLGFLFADGYVTSGNRWGLELSKNDEEHFKKFLKAIEFNGKIKYRTRTNVINGIETTNTSCSICINNSKMYDDLVRCGVVRNKTNHLVFPEEEVLKKEFQHDFIRGFFDGDGTITYNIDKERKRKEVNFICTDEGFIDSINSILIENDIHFNKGKHSKGVLSTLRTSKELEIKKFYSYIYKDVTEDIMLERKHNKFIELFEKWIGGVVPSC